jgi:hypothetical protein
MRKKQTRTVSGPGINLSSYQNNYRRRASVSQHYFEEPVFFSPHNDLKRRRERRARAKPASRSLISATPG